MRENLAGDRRRWWVLLGCAGLMLCIGTAYSWSLFTRPLMAFFGWSTVQVSFAFALMVCALGIGALLGGWLHDRYEARMVAILGATLWGLGSLLAGLGITHLGLPWLYLTYGLIGGCGAGMAYVVPGACVTRWFAHNRGLANGVIMFGFGCGSLIYNSLLGAAPAFARVADAANRIIDARNALVAGATPTTLTQGADAAAAGVVANVFSLTGLALLVLGIASAAALAPAPSSATSAAQRVHEFTPQEMLRTPTFYVLWSLVFVDCFAGLSLLGNAVPIYARLTGVTATAAATAYGWLSVCNGIGRLTWALISDRIGRISAFAIAFGLQAIAIWSLASAHAPALVALAFAVMLLCYGGILAIAPAVMADYYGTRYLGEDYGYVITAASLSGLAGPLLFSVVEEVTGSLTRAIIPIAVIVAVATVVPFAARRPRFAGAAAAGAILLLFADPRPSTAATSAFDVSPPGTIAQQQVVYLRGEAMNSRYLAVVSYVRLVPAGGADRPAVDQPYLTIYQQDPGAPTVRYRRLYQSPARNDPLELIPRSRRPAPEAPYLPQSTVKLVGAAEFRSPGVQQLVVTVHSFAADCGSSKVVVLGLDGRGRPAIDAGFQNACQLSARIAGLPSYPSASLLLTGPFYAPSAPLCCPTRARATATARWNGRRWVQQPQTFAPLRSAR